MSSIKARYPSIFSDILPHMERLLLHSKAECLLQLGNIDLLNFKLKACFQYLYLKEQISRQGKVDILSHYDTLPFYAHSIDAILTSYEPFYKKGCHATIKDLMQVLKPNGYLFIIGILPNNTSHFKETNRETLSRLYHAYVMKKEIRKAQGIIIESNYYFDDIPKPKRYTDSFLQKSMRWLNLWWPNEHHYYCIIAQKKLDPQETIPLMDSAISFHVINKNAYVKS